MPLDENYDPNAITDPTGGARNFNVFDVFKSFGYTPTQAEINQLAPSFMGRKDVYQVGSSAVAQYVDTQRKIHEQEANDPMKKWVEEQKTRAADLSTKAQDLYGQQQKILSSAPQLFGNLTPDQINEYLAPVVQGAKENSANLEGAFARRNLAGSSIEANALTGANREFLQNVLAQGLNIGMSQQKQQSDSIEHQIAQLFNQAGISTSQVGAGTSQLSQQDFNNSQTLIGLPSFLNAQSLQRELIAKQLEGPSLIDKIGSGLNLAQNFMNFFSGANTIGKMMGGGTPAAGAPAAASTMTSSAAPVLPSGAALLA